MNTAIILAAGQGTRMNSQTAKVLHKVGNKSLLQHVIDASCPLVNSINVIIGHHSESVKKTTSNEKNSGSNFFYFSKTRHLKSTFFKIHTL